MSFINNVKTTGLIDAVQSAQPEKNGFALFWLGQAGFLIKTCEGHTIGIDPCLSDFCERQSGLKRLMPTICDPESFQCDTILISHEHDDHFDVDLIEVMARDGRFARLLGPISIEPFVQGLGLERLHTRLEYGVPLELPGVVITPMFSDHGSETPNAMGFLFDFGTMRLYYAGDTAYSPNMLRAAFDAHPDIAIMPINGEFGNLNAAEAYALAGELGCRVLVPCHFWMYARHGACPLELSQIAQRETGPAVVWLAQGEGWVTDSALADI